jgi:hypothetical protein
MRPVYRVLLVSALVAALSVAGIGSVSADRERRADGVPVTANDALVHVGLRPLGTYRKRVLVRVPFESAAEATGWYVTPQTALTHHGLSSEVVHRGEFAHKAWVTGANTANVEPDGPNHRGYPTMQLFKRPRGCVTPCLLDLWVWADIPLRPGEWFSVATVSASIGNAWLAQTVNVGHEGWLHTMHVPAPGRSSWVWQRKDLKFPSRRWVRVRILVDYRPRGGAIAVWQNGALMSVAPIDPNLDLNGSGVLSQVHFGMYTPPTVGSGVIFNDALAISELR